MITDNDLKVMGLLSKGVPKFTNEIAVTLGMKLRTVQSITKKLLGTKCLKKAGEYPDPIVIHPRYNITNHGLIILRSITQSVCVIGGITQEDCVMDGRPVNIEPDGPPIPPRLNNYNKNGTVTCTVICTTNKETVSTENGEVIGEPLKKVAISTEPVIVEPMLGKTESLEEQIARLKLRASLGLVPFKQPKASPSVSVINTSSGNDPAPTPIPPNHIPPECMVPQDYITIYGEAQAAHIWLAEKKWKASKGIK